MEMVCHLDKRVGVDQSESCHTKTTQQYHAEHPLLNHVILNQLFKFFVSFEERKRLRLVNKIWYKTCLGEWRNKCAVRLGPAKTNHIGKKKLPTENCNAWSIRDFVNVLNNVNDFRELFNCPYSDYIVEGLHFTSNNITNITTWHPVDNSVNIWNTMKRLRFENCEFENEQLFEKLYIDKLTNLESICFSDCKMLKSRLQRLFDGRPISTEAYQICPRKNVQLKEVKVDGLLPSDLSFILFNSPNIQRVELVGDSEINGLDNPHYQDFYKKFANTCHVKRLMDNKPFQIKQMHLGFPSASFQSESDYTALWDKMELPIEELCYIIPDPPIHANTHNAFKPATNVHANSLKVLKAYRPTTHTMYALWLPDQEMSSLEEIYFYGGITAYLHFPEHTPNLKILYIDFKCYDSFEFVNGLMGKVPLAHKCGYNSHQVFLYLENRPHYLLKNLVRFHFDQVLHSEFWKKVAVQMPNLRILEAMLGGEEFQTICKFMPDLEELVLLHESYVNDKAITGYDRFRERVSSQQRNPDNLTRLKNLKRFVMKRTCGGFQSKRYGEEQELGYFSVYYGFLEMENLQEVIIHASRKMSMKAEKALKQHVAKVEVIRGYGPTPHGSGECCRFTAFLNYCQNQRN